VGFDLGFDSQATMVSRTRTVAAVRAGSAAEKAGLKAGDVIEELTYLDGDTEVPVKLVVTRAGAKVNLSYAPKGERRRGQTWTRMAGIADEKCGEVP
jgi:C-terminal processing protease CtpA/Prc